MVDVDLDGDLDVVSSTYNGLVIWENDGTGSLSVSGVAGGAFAYASAAVDLDGEPPLDIVTNGNSEVVVFLADGAGGYDDGVPYFTTFVGNVRSYPIWCDLDGDNDVDLVGLGDGNIVGFENAGDGTFLRNTVQTGVADADYGACGDVTGDGHADVVLTSPDVNGVQVVEGDGAFGFTVGQTLEVGVGGGAVGLADFDGDNDLDAAVATNANLELTLLDNQDGVFAEADNVSLSAVTSYLILRDANSDCVPDVVVNSISNPIFLVSPTLEFTSSPTVATGCGFGLDIGDLDGDKKPDIVDAFMFTLCVALTKP